MAVNSEATIDTLRHQLTLIDVTMADTDYHPESSAIHCAAEKHASYDAEIISCEEACFSAARWMAEDPG